MVALLSQVPSPKFRIPSQRVVLETFTLLILTLPLTIQRQLNLLMRGSIISAFQPTMISCLLVWPLPKPSTFNTQSLTLVADMTSIWVIILVRFHSVKSPLGSVSYPPITSTFHFLANAFTSAILVILCVPSTFTESTKKPSNVVVATAPGIIRWFV